MYTTGNPLLDPTLFEKFAYARKIHIMCPFASLNVTTSLLTADLHKKILDNTDNITLSFFNVGSEFERLTGGLSWDKCYNNAKAFIEARDKYRPDYRIFIGCNAVKDSNLKAVKQAFRQYHVEWAVDAELRWAGPVVTGVVDRAIMYPTFRCDGHEGVLEIKWNGNIEACSYDFTEETLYANIWTDNWETIRQKFFGLWRKPFHLCARCDYYHLYWRVKRNHFRPVKDYSWQKPFLKEGQPYQA
jgi:MoaA/NifB/PqqE/SkfB family radical SAM enzyme